MIQNKSTPVAAVVDAVSAHEAVRSGAPARRCARAANAPPLIRSTMPPQFLHTGRMYTFSLGYIFVHTNYKKVVLKIRNSIC